MTKQLRSLLQLSHPSWPPSTAQMPSHRQPFSTRPSSSLQASSPSCSPPCPSPSTAPPPTSAPSPPASLIHQQPTLHTLPHPLSKSVGFMQASKGQTFKGNVPLSFLGLNEHAKMFRALSLLTWEDVVRDKTFQSHFPIMEDAPSLVQLMGGSRRHRGVEAALKRWRQDADKARQQRAIQSAARVQSPSRQRRLAHAVASAGAVHARKHSTAVASASAVCAQQNSAAVASAAAARARHPHTVHQLPPPLSCLPYFRHHLVSHRATLTRERRADTSSFSSSISSSSGSISRLRSSGGAGELGSSEGEQKTSSSHGSRCGLEDDAGPSKGAVPHNGSCAWGSSSSHRRSSSESSNSSTRHAGPGSLTQEASSSQHSLLDGCAMPPGSSPSSLLLDAGPHSWITVFPGPTAEQNASVHTDPELAACSVPHFDERFSFPSVLTQHEPGSREWFAAQEDSFRGEAGGADADSTCSVDGSESSDSDGSESESEEGGDDSEASHGGGFVVREGDVADVLPLSSTLQGLEAVSSTQWGAQDGTDTEGDDVEEEGEEDEDDGEGSLPAIWGLAAQEVPLGPQGLAQLLLRAHRVLQDVRQPTSDEGSEGEGDVGGVGAVAVFHVEQENKDDSDQEESEGGGAGTSAAFTKGGLVFNFWSKAPLG